jgi:NIPSNAP
MQGLTAIPPSSLHLDPHFSKEADMLVEMRTYQIAPGKVAEFLAFYEREGLGIISRYARLQGCWTKESGTLNSVVFCWAYDSYAHRAEQRAKLAADPHWQAFTPHMLPYLVHQESVFLAPAPFSPTV